MKAVHVTVYGKRDLVAPKFKIKLLVPKKTAKLALHDDTIEL